MEFFASIQKWDTFFQNKTFFKSLTLSYCKIETCILMPIPSIGPKVVLDLSKLFWIGFKFFGHLSKSKIQYSTLSI